ncbi:hypothetical protein [Geothrix fermentans]|uniref:hypothetical protein n=1 Tax=Geothrix fermentans TaxID=44676 RepID=UPI0003FB8A56|nr:hypothetical protein [Geothrix fermentans]
MPIPTPPAHQAPQPPPTFRARTRSLEYLQHLAARPLEVMPFLTATGERAWAQGWNPTVLFPESGPEGESAVFTTPGTWWVCTEFSAPEAGRPARITYAHFTPGRDVTTIHITLAPEGPGGTLARVRYTWTGLSAEGNAFVDGHTAAGFEQDMREWEADLNAALRRRR